ncbi:hypothetical protein K466DRAFT_664821 [Polyporus arcularius HHB13444]|uniref:Uncharacterized protein n=1 Tax=Polyporus arcularius HHB13444 TaxID=1314778 RepID=A0A5C3P5K4_9APHY|nr:hypothetical protein K466DRAFT_664821 [Polyporus arcularius HHB13444]
MLRPAQTRLYKWVLLPAVNEQILAFSRTIDSHPDLGLLVETLPLQYLPSLSFYPLPAHIAGRLSNIRMAKFAGLARQYPAGCSFIVCSPPLLWLDYAAPIPLPLMLCGNNLTLLEIDARHSYASTVDYKGIAALEKLHTLCPTLHENLRCVAITHRVEDQTVEATIRQLEALDPKIQDVLARPAFWGLRSFGWKVLCKEPPTDVEQQKWQRAVAPFLQVMADRNVLLLRVAECPKGVQ